MSVLFKDILFSFYCFFFASVDDISFFTIFCRSSNFLLSSLYLFINVKNSFIVRILAELCRWKEVYIETGETCQDFGEKKKKNQCIIIHGILEKGK